MFNLKKVVTMLEPCKVCERETVIKELINLARGEEVKILESAPDLEKEIKKFHDDRKDSYKFECKRFYNFLNINISRGDGKYTGSINLDTVKTVDFIEGRNPDRTGYVRYNAKKMFGDKIINPELTELKSGETWLVNSSKESYYGEIGYNQVFEPYKSDYGYVGYGEYACMINYRTENYPRYGVDDKIIFSGVSSLFVPHGLGKKVYQQILSANDGGKNK